MFLREFVFFYLATAFKDLTNTYLQMTVLRVILCWLGSLFACSVFRYWVGITETEARSNLHPINLSLRITGSIVLIISYLRLHDAA